MYTANTMASAIEALGLSLPGSSAQEAVGAAKRDDCRRAGAAVVQLLSRGIRPSDILTRHAFENAITVVIALGGSTNAVLHLLAIAQAAGVRLKLDDFTRIGRRVPVLADLRPSGRYLMSELVAIGGIQPLMKRLLEARPAARGLPDRDRPYAGPEPARMWPTIRPPRTSCARLSNPIKKDSHLVVLYGNVAPEGAVAKITGKEGLQLHRSARASLTARRARPRRSWVTKCDAGDVIVIRYEGPKGGPGMREMLSPTGALIGRGLGDKVALITDGRFSGGSHGFVVGHICPRGGVGGPLALLRNGDRITIDAQRRRIDVDLSAAELQAPTSALEAAATLCDPGRAGEICPRRQQRLGRRGDRRNSITSKSKRRG